MAIAAWSGGGAFASRYKSTKQNRWVVAGESVQKQQSFWYCRLPRHDGPWEHDMIGMATTKRFAPGSFTFSPTGCWAPIPLRWRYLGRSGEQPFVADFTNTALNGKLDPSTKRNWPAGWVQDKNGLTSTNANELKEGGAMLPLCGDRPGVRSHKPICGSIVDIFSAVTERRQLWAPVRCSQAYVPCSKYAGKGIGIFWRHAAMLSRKAQISRLIWTTDPALKNAKQWQK